MPYSAYQRTRSPTDATRSDTRFPYTTLFHAAVLRREGLLSRVETLTPLSGEAGERLKQMASGRDVTLQLVQFVLLVLDHRLDQVADRHHAQHRVVVDHRQVADAALGDDLHAAFGGVVDADADHVGGHDVAHQRVGGGAALQHHLARVVALGKDRKSTRLTYSH